MVSERYRARSSIGNMLVNLDKKATRALQSGPAVRKDEVTSSSIAPGAVDSAAYAKESVRDAAIGRGAVGTENLGIINEINSDGPLSINAPGGLNLNGSEMMPVGALVMYAGPVAPAGWLSANGAAVSRETYAPLFSVIGTSYGAGDGSTTFNIPQQISSTYGYIIKAQ